MAGVIWPTDTYVGFRRIGFNPIYSMAAVPFIHGSFSYVRSLVAQPTSAFLAADYMTIGTSCGTADS